MHRCEVDRLDWRQTYWVPAVVSPERNWAGFPGCRKGARFVVHSQTFRASSEEFEVFDSQLSCLSWIMLNRAELSRTLPGVRVRAVALNRWLLGLE